MTFDQTLATGTLAGALILFAWGYWRHDLVAMLALLVLVVAEVIPVDDAFDGFGHPAVITVAAMLVLSKALEKSGVVALLANRLGSVQSKPYLALVSLTCLVTALSAFMNNIGALALMMPVALQIAADCRVHPSRLLMPVAFGSILGGLTTLVGTPPNIIISSYRAEQAGAPFGIFDFTPVGLSVAAAGVLAIVLFSKVLLPRRTRSCNEDAFAHLDPYLTELAVPNGSPCGGQTVGELEELGQNDISIPALIRDGHWTPAPGATMRLAVGDVLVIESEPGPLRALVERTGLELAHEKSFTSKDLASEDVVLTEAVIMPGSPLERRTPASIGLRSRFGLNLLGVARQSTRIVERLARTPLRVGDVMLLQGETRAMPETLARIGSLPLEDRGLELPGPLRLMPVALFVAALASSVSGLLPIQVALLAAALAVVLFGFLPLRDTYNSIDWPVIVLLGAMIPVGQSLETTGITPIVAENLMSAAAGVPPAFVVAILLVSALLLSNVVNNAATAILMAPIALTVASGLNVSADPFLMAVAVGSSCAFMTPIGHQSNLLVMGPGGYDFGDYWKLGFPVSLIVGLVAVPMILWIWPL